MGAGAVVESGHIFACNLGMTVLLVIGTILTGKLECSTSRDFGTENLQILHN